MCFFFFLDFRLSVGAGDVVHVRFSNVTAHRSSRIQPGNYAHQKAQ